jgi:selenocysteine lyase/cysteine desulfurase
MGIENICRREEELLERAFAGLDKIKGLQILADNVRDRLGMISFYLENLHYNLVVQVLNDKYGIQTRGGCACAGTYGHFLLEVSYEKSLEITDKISHGDLSDKPGWIRWSLHPTMTNDEVDLMITALNDIAENAGVYKNDYEHILRSNIFIHKKQVAETGWMDNWFNAE